MTIEQQISFLKKSIKQGDYNISELDKKFDKAIQETREITFVYQIKTVHPDLREHLKTFNSYGKQSKAKVISTLQDVNRMIHTRNPNKKVMLALLNQITKTNFYADKLQEKMLLESAITRQAKFEKEILKVV